MHSSFITCVFTCICVFVVITDSLPDTVLRISPSANYNLDMMLDQGDRGDGIVSATRYPIESNIRLGQLEDNLNNIKTMLDMLKRQNTALQARVDYLETCECSKRKCVWEGRDMDEGSRWSPDSNTVCYCTHGKVQCDLKRSQNNTFLFIYFFFFFVTCSMLRLCSSIIHMAAVRHDPPFKKVFFFRFLPFKSLGCEHEGEIYEDGKQFVSRSNPCLKCSCSVSLLCVCVCVCVCVCCVQDNVRHQHGSQWKLTNDPCTTCTCTEGLVQCESERCNIRCKNPASPPPGSCCPVCDGDGQTRCGVASCSAARCADAYTPPGECCPRCPDCEYGNRIFTNGETFSNPLNPCEDCVCQDGHVNCGNRECSRPNCNYPRSGTCCQNNCNGCSYAGNEYPNGVEFPHPVDKCRTFMCLCKQCQVSNCADASTPSGECCPQCPEAPAECFFEGQRYSHLQQFHHPSDSCQSCSCTNGEVSCHRRPCPSAVCSHPVIQDCCRTCDGCMYVGQEYQNGQDFPDPADHCSRCMCRNGQVTCNRTPCPNPGCSNPIIRPGQCCPVCDDCQYEGRVYPNGEPFQSPTAPCEECRCSNGRVNCEMKWCPQQCAHPVSMRDCCPVCDGCLYEGQRYGNTQTFYAPSDPCNRCVCQSGSVTCSPVTCPPVSCSNPIIPPGQCCPQCRGQCVNVCVFQDGEVNCVGPDCPKLTCMHQVTDPSSCCPRCRGCIYDGVQHLEGSTWFASSSPCMSCMCVNGVTTCSEVHCLSTCLNQISVPGECCPVCADCVYEGHVYGPGESFHPSDDPCQICTCEVRLNGKQHLRCYRKQCPSLVDCPKHNILYSGSDSCCPVCAQPLSNCTATLIGNEVLATDDPCFTCQCKDLTWTCIHRGCPPLSCPLADQHTPPDSCCPVCDDAHLECVYDGQQYNHNDHWEVDECTSCTCVYGDVHCQTQRCPTLTCASDETSALVPGMCCPHCIPHPATCIVFGDPHYRTFDGKMVNFQGKCTYILAQDCEGRDFSVHVSNEDRGRKGVSWTKEVTVFIGDIVVQLFQNWIVKVDYQQVSLPFLKEPYVYLERKTNTILLNTNVGLKVSWNGRSHLEVSVPGTYKKQMCGLCGNFNNYPQDDMKLRNGQITNSEAVFGNNWKVGSGNPSVQCPDAININPCTEAGYSAHKTANARCAVLKSPVFERCHKLVPPEMFYASCVYDQCACGSNVDECLCDVLEAYASECRKAGVILQWRSPTLCAVGCPLDRGYVFDECGPPCPKTCFNKDVPLGVIEAHCFKPCVPGCQCPAGLVEHNSHCIAPEKCPKIIHGNL
uniref:Kielin cysteine rich BMP regulator n=1 Tax=Cyprinus carpio carpio TaxID=630221 RepID=A0A9J8B1X1_CYPCA